LRQVIHFAGGRRFGEAVASRISLEANANKEPAHAFTLHTLIIAVITCGFARWAFGPIFLTDCALIYSRASMRARHAPAFPIGQDSVMAGRSTACTNCDWFRALHAVGQYILPPQPLRWLCLILLCGPSCATARTGLEYFARTASSERASADFGNYSV
jgi:hypothetical protein